MCMFGIIESEKEWHHTHLVSHMAILFTYQTIGIYYYFAFISEVYQKIRIEMIPERIDSMEYFRDFYWPHQLTLIHFWPVKQQIRCTKNGHAKNPNGIWKLVDFWLKIVQKCSSARMFATCFDCERNCCYLYNNKFDRRVVSIEFRPSISPSCYNNSKYGIPFFVIVYIWFEFCEKSLICNIPIWSWLWII